jgi:hypothetical protein
VPVRINSSKQPPALDPKNHWGAKLWALGAYIGVTAYLIFAIIVIGALVLLTRDQARRAHADARRVEAQAQRELIALASKIVDRL